MNSEASSELGCLGGLPEKFLSVPFSHYSFRVQRRSQVSQFSHIFMCAFLLFEQGNKKLSGRTLSKRHRYSLLVGSFSHPVVHFTSTVACFCLISHNAFQLKSLLQVISVTQFQVYPSFSGIPYSMESPLVGGRLVVIHRCHLPNPFVFHTGNAASRLLNPSGLFQQAILTNIPFLPSDHCSHLLGKLPGGLFTSLLKHLSVLCLILILCRLMLGFY